MLGLLLPLTEREPETLPLELGEELELALRAALTLALLWPLMLMLGLGEALLLPLRWGEEEGLLLPLLLPVAVGVLEEEAGTAMPLSAWPTCSRGATASTTGPSSPAGREAVAMWPVRSAVAV